MVGVYYTYVMKQTALTQVEDIENIEAGDVLVVKRNGEVVADKVEVTEIKTCGFSGASEPQTDGEIEFGSDLHDLLTEALGSNSQFSDDFEVYKTEAVDGETDVDAVESDGEVIAEGDTLADGETGDEITVESLTADVDSGSVLSWMDYTASDGHRTQLLSATFQHIDDGRVNVENE